MYIHLILLTLSFSLWASELRWQPVTSEKQKECTEESYCRVLEGKTSFEILLSPAAKGGRLVLNEIAIKSLATGEILNYPVQEMNSLELNEYFKLYKVQLRAKGPWDLALAAYSSAREGPVFHYFVFDEKTQKFIQSDATAPRLIRDKKPGIFKSEIQGTEYVLGKDLKIRQVQK